jgi:hypothetical protein
MRGPACGAPEAPGAVVSVEGIVGTGVRSSAPAVGAEQSSVDYAARS